MLIDKRIVENLRVKRLIVNAFFTLLEKYDLENNIHQRNYTDYAGDMPQNSIERYNLYYAAGTAYNGTIEWLKGGCRESVKEITQSLGKFMKFNTGDSAHKIPQ